MSTLGIVTASSVECVDAAAEALRQGGTAADAIVAAGFATAAGSPAMTSLAGGGAFLHYNAASDQATVCDAFAAAPGLAGRRVGESGAADGGRPNGDLPPIDVRELEIDFRSGGTRQTFHIGRGTAAVPGILSGLAAVSERWGVLPFASLLAPTIRRLREGVSLTAYQVACNRVLGDILHQSELGQRLFFSDGQLLPAGAKFVNSELADTLADLASMGYAEWEQTRFVPLCLEAFGETAGGWLTEKDFRDYTPVFRTPLTTTYCGCEIATNPPPSVGGGFIAETLALFEEAKLLPNEPSTYSQRLVAVLRAVSEVRAEDHAVLTRPDARERFQQRLTAILDDTPSGRVRPENREPRSPGNTVHVNVIDSQGNAAALTLSHGEGNGCDVPGTGILMNNFLGEEDLFPGGFFRFEAGERLATMMAPTFVRAGDGTIAILGSGGANRIRTAIPQTLARLLHARFEDPQRVVEEGRLHVEDGVLSAETAFLPGRSDQLDTARSLVSETREFDSYSLFFGGVHVAVRYPDGRLAGAGDPRRGGLCRIVESA